MIPNGTAEFVESAKPFHLGPFHRGPFHRRLGLLMGVGMLVAGCVVAMGLSPARAQSQPRAVIELFTSQGCSSCPAADKLLGELARDPSIVAISLPIDYWDYLGWKDTLASARHTARQRAYANRRSDREVYTPQVVVNGTMEVLGSDKAAITRAATQTSGKAMMLPVTLAPSGNQLVVNVQSGKAENAEVWLCAIARKISVAVERGENHDKTLTYNNVARRWTKLGNWSGKAESFSVPLADLKGADIDAAAVIVQLGSGEKPGAILGAAFADLR